MRAEIRILYYYFLDDHSGWRRKDRAAVMEEDFIHWGLRQYTHVERFNHIQHIIAKYIGSNANKFGRFSL
jgi:hypothetical protein